MWRPVVVSTPPAGEPLSLVSAKAQVRLMPDETHDDVLIGDYIAAARGHVEGVTGTKLYTQTLTLKTNDWADLANLPVAPIQSLTISYVDTSGSSQTLSASVYEARLDGLEPSVALKYGQTYPDTQEGSLITLTAVAGYGIETAQPPAISQALRLIVADLYAFRENAQVGATASLIPSAANVEALLANHRLHLIA
jgi:uncharacterized phiE125 gp8 family phage protein